MKYINEINAFWRFVDTTPLSGGAMLLYFALIQLHNTSKCKRTIYINNDRIKSIVRVSEKTLIKHRQELVDVGLLLYTSRQRVKNSGQYRLLSFEKGEVGKVVSIVQTAVINTAVCTADSETTGDFTADTSADCSDLYIQDETKPFIYIEKGTNKDLDFLLTVCEQNNIEVDEQTCKWLLGLLKNYSSPWIQKALREAVKKNKFSHKYVEGILANWKKSGRVTIINNNNNIEASKPYKKTLFHNFEQRSDKYTAEQLEAIAAKKRMEHSEKMKSQKGNESYTCFLL